MDVHACDAWRPSLLAMGDPRGATGAATGVGCGVFVLSKRGHGCRPPPLARERMGDRPLRFAFDSQLTMGKCLKRTRVNSWDELFYFLCETGALWELFAGCGRIFAQGRVAVQYCTVRYRRTSFIPER
jgi:hypothetical protein